jgi:hypothetical protein
VVAACAVGPDARALRHNASLALFFMRFSPGVAVFAGHHHQFHIFNKSGKP